MFRTLIISKGEWVGIEDNWVVVRSNVSNNRVPIEDIYSVIIDNQATTITTNVITRLIQKNIHIMICNEFHLPECLMLPLNTHYRPLNVIRKQLEQTKEFKDTMWQKIIRAKIANQIFVLKYSNCEEWIIDRLNQFILEVMPNDPMNAEGLAAKMFFRALYGSEFIRMADDSINAALNYGYSIIRSAVARSLNAYGYNCLLGIHHIGEANAFNLADDMMEPLRPIVDYWVDINNNDLVDGLTIEQRRSLINLVNWNVKLGNKKMKLRYAIDKYISSMTTAIDRGNPHLLDIPILTEDATCTTDS